MPGRSALINEISGLIENIIVVGEKYPVIDGYNIVAIGEEQDVKIGGRYDEATGLFSEPIPVEPEPQPPSEYENLSNYILDVDFRVVMLEMGL